MLIISSFFINAAILVSFITVGNLFLREKGVNPSSPLFRKILTGISYGILGCILMLYSIQYSSKVIIDFRYIPIIIMALYASWESALVSSLVIGVFRIIYFGLNKTSIVAILILIAFAVALFIVTKLKYKTLVKWIFALLSLYIIFAIGLSTLMPNFHTFTQILIPFFIGIALVAFMMYILTEYTESSNIIYRKMKEDLKKDFLTGLNNVRQFDRNLNTALSVAKEKDMKLSILFLDIDFFKKINDTYGHQEGDLVLKELSNILINTCRSYDNISRNGGEEFSIILPDCPLEKAVEIAERIRKSVEQHEFISSLGKKIKITISIGVSTFPETTSNPEKLVEQADIALYNAKRAGRNRVVISHS